MSAISVGCLKKPLGDVANVISGYAFKSSEFGEQGIPVIKIKNIRVGFVDLSDADHVDEKYLAIPDRFHVRRGDILISLTGSHITQPNSVVGRVARHAVDLPRCLLNQRAGKIIVKDQGRCDANFLFYALSEQETLHAIAMKAHGAASQANVSPSQVESIEIPLPPLPIQRRIAGILSAYDELIENSQRRIKILESMARALYREWFVHFRFPGHESVPRVPSPMGEIPEGWAVKNLESLMTSHIGGGWGKEVPDDDHTDPAWVIRGTDIPDARSSQVAGVPHRFHTPSNLRSRRIATGDILFEVSGGSKGQPVGRTLFITPQLMSAFSGDVICASFCKRVCPNHNVYGGELLYLSFLEGYESGEIEQFQVQSTGISNFKWTEYIAKTLRVIPPELLSSHFRHQVSPLFAEIATIGLQIQNLRCTRDLLLPRLLSGQIDVEAIDS